MATTTFVNGATLSDAAWFNDVDAITYDVFNAATTAALARTAISAARTDGANTFASGTQTFSGLGQFNLGLNVAGSAFTSRGITDNATATALTLSGAGANSITIANSASAPTIGTTAGNVVIAPAGNPSAAFQSVASAVNYVQLYGQATGLGVSVGAVGTDSNIQLMLVSKGTNGIALAAGGVTQAFVNGDPTSTRYITLAGSNGGNPTISTSAGALAITPSTVITGNLSVLAATATTAGGNATPGIQVGSANIGIYWGSGAPTISAPRGSLYIRTDNGANTSLYVNRDGVTTWAAVTSA